MEVYKKMLENEFQVIGQFIMQVPPEPPILKSLYITGFTSLYCHCARIIVVFFLPHQHSAGNALQGEGAQIERAWQASTTSSSSTNRAALFSTRLALFSTRSVLFSSLCRCFPFLQATLVCPAGLWIDGTSGYQRQFEVGKSVAFHACHLAAALAHPGLRRHRFPSSWHLWPPLLSVSHWYLLLSRSWLFQRKLAIFYEVQTRCCAVCLRQK